MTVEAGGSASSDDITWVGLNANGILDVNGTLNVGSHLWVGWNAPGGSLAGELNINSGGIVNVSGQLGLNWQNNAGTTGLINLNDGGILNLSQIAGSGDSVRDNSTLTIAGSGIITYAGDNVATFQNQYIDTGKFVAAEAGKSLQALYDVDADLTTVSVVPEASTTALIFSMVAFAAVSIRRRKR